MPNYAYHFARAEGRIVRNLYRLSLPTIAQKRIPETREIPIDVFSYSGESTLPEQVASIRSFLKYAGRPRSFTVVSDGTYSRENLQLLRQLDSAVSVEDSPALPGNLPQALLSYLRTHPTGKQLALIMSLPRERPALYIDSDVMFFPGAGRLGQLLENPAAPAFYLEDCGFAGDERLLHTAGEKERPVNTGVLLLFKPLDWSLSVSRFLELKGEPIFFTNQTMTHLTMHANGGLPFDRSRYVLELNDQFELADRYAGPSLVLRHYVNPVRHKFWRSFRH